jgi:fatty acid desaturase
MDKLTIRAKELPAKLKLIDDEWGWRELLRVWGTILLALLICRFASHPLVWVLGFLVVGHMQYHLSVLGHHALHRNLFSQRGCNEFVARYLLHGSLGLPNEPMRRNHMSHHKYFEQEQDYERDNYDFTLSGRGTASGFRRWAIGAYLGGAIVPAVGRVVRGANKEAARRGNQNRSALSNTLRDWLPVASAQICLFLLYWALTGVWWSYSLWVVSIFTLLAGFSATRAMLEHADPVSPPQRLMTFPCSGFERYLLGACNFNFHAEHHLYSGVPACNLEKLHYYLKENGGLHGVVEIQSYLSRIRYISRTLKDQQSA